MTRYLLPLAAWLLASLAPSAQAHGSAHGSPPAATLAAPEQTDWGIAADRRAARRSLTVTMDDRMRFSPDTLQVREGDTLRLVLHNRGRLLHEFVIGTPAALDEHAALMAKFPDMQHDNPWMAHVPPGQRGEIVWTFNRPGHFGFACLIAGHYQAGMVGRITVLPRQAAGRPASTSPAPAASGAVHVH